MHKLLLPPHPDDVYQSSALCSCGEFQYDAESQTALINELKNIYSEWSKHIYSKKDDHLVYPGGPPCDPDCPGEWSTYHDGYSWGYEKGLAER